MFRNVIIDNAFTTSCLQYSLKQTKRLHNTASDFYKNLR